MAEDADEFVFFFGKFVLFDYLFLQAFDLSCKRGVELVHLGELVAYDFEHYLHSDIRTRELILLFVHLDVLREIAYRGAREYIPQCLKSFFRIVCHTPRDKTIVTAKNM